MSLFKSFMPILSILIHAVNLSLQSGSVIFSFKKTTLNPVYTYLSKFLVYLRNLIITLNLNTALSQWEDAGLGLSLSLMVFHKDQCYNPSPLYMLPLGCVISRYVMSLLCYTDESPLSNPVSCIAGLVSSVLLIGIPGRGIQELQYIQNIAAMDADESAETST